MRNGPTIDIILVPMWDGIEFSYLFSFLYSLHAEQQRQRLEEKARRRSEVQSLEREREEMGRRRSGTLLFFR